MKNKIVCIEGSDGVGKATQSKILADRLGREGGCTLFSFPNYASTAGEMIKRLLVEDANQVLVGQKAGNFFNPAPVNFVHDDGARALILQSLMLTNRLESGKALRAAQAHGHIVLDRYDASAMVYGSLDGLDMNWLIETNEQLPIHPDVYILLDAPVATSFERRPDRRDRYESDPAFLEKVRIAYLKLFAERQAVHVGKTVDTDLLRGPGHNRGWNAIADAIDERQNAFSSWHTVDATGSIEEVAALVWAAAGFAS